MLRRSTESSRFRLQEDAIRAEEERIAQYAAEKERREEERRQLEKKKADDQGRCGKLTLCVPDLFLQLAVLANCFRDALLLAKAARISPQRQLIRVEEHFSASRHSPWPNTVSGDVY